jgi:flagellar hook assembly protein FlgD
VFTPNGDGHNDQIEVAFALLKLRNPIRVEIQVVGTDGGVVWEETREELRAGKQTFTWEGRDSGGHRVPPGIYIVQVVAFPDQGEVRRLSPLYVIY